MNLDISLNFFDENETTWNLRKYIRDVPFAGPELMAYIDALITGAEMAGQVNAIRNMFVDEKKSPHTGKIYGRIHAPGLPTIWFVHDIKLGSTEKFNHDPLEVVNET